MFDPLIDWLVELQHSSPHVPKALIAGTLVSTVCGVVGCFIILRRTAFLADALAHSMLAGVVCGYLLMKVAFGQEANAPAMLVGSLIAGFLTVGMVGFVKKFSRIKEDAVIGIMYTGIFSLGGVLLSLFSHYVHIDLVHFVTGQLLVVNNGDLWMMAIVASTVLTMVILLFRQLQLISFDSVMAASIGVPVLAIDYVLTTCTSLVVVSGVNIVGMILVVGLLIIPAATAYLLCDRLSRMLVVSALFGVSGFLAGYLMSERINVAPGSAVVLSCAIQFLIVFAVAPRYGFFADWLRRRRMVPQELVEDVLGSILRSPGESATLAAIGGHISANLERIRRAVRSLERQNLLMVADHAVTLTEAGRHEARRLLRAHRLWESYLAHVGAPAETLHKKAHVLEHLHDEATVDYLDDKLGHPLRDPHGAEIPEDFVHLVPGTEIKASLLRRGHRAQVLRIEPPAANTPLQVGMTVTAGPRQQHGAKWQLILPNGERISLDHHTVDAVTVRFEGPAPAAARDDVASPTASGSG